MIVVKIIMALLGIAVFIALFAGVFLIFGNAVKEYGLASDELHLVVNQNGYKFKKIFNRWHIWIDKCGMWFSIGQFEKIGCTNPYNEEYKALKEYESTL